MGKRGILVVLVLWLATGCAPAASRPSAAGEGWVAEDEVVYQVFVRSFRDSNGDGIGDLRGIRDELGYLKDLGITSILLTPIQPSPFYHNYFPTSFEGVEPAYGTERDYRDLVAAVHERGMKIYLDEEIQYLAEGHPWWTQSAGNPASPYTRFMLYRGSGNTSPATAVFELTTTATWDGRNIGLTTLNLRDPELRDYFARLFAGLVDPNGDGRFGDGVDGFRIDHMMDELDGKPQLGNLFATFWAPIFARARATNPRVRILAEQADWGWGEDFLARAGADLVFAFPLRMAVAKLDRAEIARAISESVAKTPAGKGRMVFIENHDVNRFASEVGSDPRKERIGAALDLLLKGTPLIYYGQEIGMRGKHQAGWTADGADIPDREAMEWTRKVEGPGAAVWYKGNGPWWTSRYARDDDGVSVEEELRDAASLLSYYRRLLALRRARPELRSGDERVLDLGGDHVLAVLRTSGPRASLLLVNLGDAPATVRLGAADLPPALAGGKLKDLLSGEALPAAAVPLPAWGVRLVSGK